METSTKESIKTSLLEWIATRTDDAVIHPKEGYYPFDVIAEAYEKGESDGQEKIKSDLTESFRKVFVKNTEKTTLMVNTLLDNFGQDEIAPKKLFLDPSISGVKILFALKESDYLNDVFLDKYYALISDMIASNISNEYKLDIGFVVDSDNRNFDLIKNDGYGLAINLENGQTVY